jgi:anti-anti-sigma factor
MDGIQIQVERASGNPDISVIMINGYIDTTTSSELERVIQNLLREQRYKIIVDLSGVDYISSAGWGIFISEIKNLRNHRGDLKLANMSANVNEVYELLEFATILVATSTVEEAVRIFEGTASDPSAAKKPAPAKPAPAPPAPAPALERPAPAAVVQPKAPMTPPMPPRMPAPPAPQPARFATPPPASAVAPAPAPVSATPPLASLIDRIREVVKAHPEWGAWKIKGELNLRRAGQPKVSWSEVKAELKFSQLGTKEQRFAFSRGTDGKNG